MKQLHKCDILVIKTRGGFMKKIFKYFIVLILILLLVACGKPEDITQPDGGNEREDIDSIADIEGLSEEDNKELLELIKVSYQNDFPTAIVWVENKSDKIFTGDIHARFYSGGKSQIGYDMLIIEKLMPNGKVYARINLDSPDIVDFKHSFSREINFEETKKFSNIFQDELTDALNDMMNRGFGGPEEYAASWFENILKMEVFGDEGGYYAVATVNTDNEEYIDRITWTIFANFKEAELDKVLTRNEDEEILLEIYR